MTKTLQSQLGLADHRTVAGFAVDQAHLDRILVVEILADGQPFAVVRADRFCPALVKEGVTNAQTNHGFVAMLPERLIATTRKISARLANLKTAVGKPIDLERTPPADPQLAAAGGIDGVQGLVVSGWVKAAPGSALLLRAQASGEEVAATIARTWSSRTIGGEERPVLTFQLHLPPALADGRPHLISVVTPAGIPLAGTPLKFVAKAVKRP